MKLSQIYVFNITWQNSTRISFYMYMFWASTPFPCATHNDMNDNPTWNACRKARIGVIINVTRNLCKEWRFKPSKTIYRSQQRSPLPQCYISVPILSYEICLLRFSLAVFIYLMYSIKNSIYIFLNDKTVKSLIPCLAIITFKLSLRN